MGLENLQSIFNKINDNQADLHDGLPMESISNRLFDHTFGSNNAYQGLVKIGGIQNEQSPSPLMAITNVFSDSIVNGHSLGKIRVNFQGGLLQTHLDITGNENYPYAGNTSPFNTPGQPVPNTPDIEPLEFGTGDLVLTSMYNESHGKAPTRPIFDGNAGDVQSDLQLYFTPKGEGIVNLDIKNSDISTRSRQPFVIKPIGAVGKNETASGYNRDFIPYNAFKDDLFRLTAFQFGTNKGLLSLAQDNLVNRLIGDKSPPDNPLGWIMAPPVPVPMTGLLNFYHQSAQTAGGRLASLRKPFHAEYSKRLNLLGTTPPLPGIPGLPNFTMANQGDYPSVTFYKDSPLRKLLAKKPKDKTKTKIVTDEAGAQTTVSTGERTFGNKLHQAAVKLYNAAVNKAADALDTEIDAIPQIGERPTKRFISLKGKDSLDVTVDAAGNPIKRSDTNVKPVDEISRSKPVSDFDQATFEKEMIDPGDFYVRIKDLRDGELIYFRGFITGITENVTPSWNPTQYIGRSEDVYNYQKAERDLSFNLRVAPANRLEFDNMYPKMNRLTSLAYPEYLVDESAGATRMKAPFTELYMAHIGEQSKGQFGFIKSLTYTVSEQGDWDVRSLKPRVFDIAVGYQILSRRAPSLTNPITEKPHQFYGN